MPFQPDDPFPKQRGYSIRSKDWNDLVLEVQRLDHDKLNKTSDTMTGPLTIADGLRSVHPSDKIHLEGQLGIYAPEIDRAQNALNFASGDRSQEFFLHRYTAGYIYQDLAFDHNIFPRVALGAQREHLFIGTTSAHQVVLSTNNRPRLVIGAEGSIGIGTTSPTNKLHMFHSGPGLTIDGDAFPGFRMAVNGQQVALAQIRTDDGNTLDFGSSGSTAISFLTSSARRLHITTAGNIGIGKTNPNTALDVVGTVTATTFVGNGTVPRGVIVMWSGQINTIPEGWALCNGTNGTPDLRDRFIAGAGGKYNVGTTGGEEVHRLTIDEMPGHNHGNGIWNLLVNNQGNGTTTQTDATAGEIDTRNAQPIQQVGGGGAHENRPPYYALALIMKL